MDLAASQDAYRDSQRARRVFAQVRNAERYYAAQLNKVASQIDALVKGMAPASRADLDTLQRMLERYSDVLRPWAAAVSQRMLAEVARRDAAAWRRYSKLMGTTLRRELLETPMGDQLARLLDLQTDLITSLPRDAARRVHDLAIAGLASGARPDLISAEIMRTGQVSKSRATLIARTETGRAASTMTQLRAQAIGSPGYIWRSAHDYKVRPEIGSRHFAQLNTLAAGSHRKLDGTFHRWNEPPVASPRGERAMPGAIYNCRCYPEPILPGDV